MHRLCRHTRPEARSLQVLPTSGLGFRGLVRVEGFTWGFRIERFVA